MPAQFFGAQAAVTFLNRAFANTSPSNAAFTNQVTNATASLTAGADATQAISYTSFAKTFGSAYAGQTAAQLSTLLMTNLGLLPNAALEAALADYITAAGTGSVGIVALQLASLLSAKEGDATYGTAAAAWNNEVNSAAAYSGNPANTSASVGDVVVPPVTQGQTFTLTANVENVLGTAGNDTIIAGEGSAGGAHTLGASDVINGAGGTDLIDIINGNALIAALTPRLTSVEKVQDQALTAHTLNMVNATGTTEIWSNNSTAALTVTNIGEKALIGAKGGNSSALTVQANAAAITGDLAISLDKAKVGAMTVNSTGGVGATGYTSTTINAVAGTGTERNTVASLDAGSTLATVKVIGDGALTVAGNLAATVRTIDASANKGGANLSITNNTGNTTFTGGEGADRINFGGTLTLADKVDGGAARDTLGVTSQASIIAGLQVTNTEILELATLNGTLNAALIAGVDEVQVTTALDDVALAIVNGLTSNSTFVTNDNGNVQLNLTNAQVAGTQDTLNLKTGVTGTTNVGTDVWVSATGVETVAYTQNNLAAAGADTEVSFWDAVDGVIDMQSLSITNTAGNTARFNGLVNTIKTVNASAAAGAVAVSVATGNSTNGVSITGGAGADSLTGGDGKDIIVAGAGNDAVSGDAFTTILGTGGVAIPQVSTITIANAEVGDVFTVNGTAVTWTGVEATDNAAVIAAAATAGVTVTADAAAVATSGTFIMNGAAAGTAFALPTVAATNVAAKPEVSTVTINNASVYDAGDVVTVTVNGTNYSVTATVGQTAAAIAGLLATQISSLSAGANAMTAVAGGVGGNVITLTGANATTNYAVSAATTNVNGGAQTQTAQVTTLTLAGTVDAADSFSVNVNGTVYQGATTAALAAAIGTGPIGAPIASAVAVGQVITLTGLANGTAFTAAAGPTINQPAVADTVTLNFTPTTTFDGTVGAVTGDTYTVTIGGNVVAVGASAVDRTAATFAADFVTAFNASPLPASGVTATAVAGVVTVTGQPVGTNVTVAGEAVIFKAANTA